MLAPDLLARHTPAPQNRSCVHCACGHGGHRLVHVCMSIQHEHWVQPELRAARGWLAAERVPVTGTSPRGVGISVLSARHCEQLGNTQGRRPLVAPRAYPVRRGVDAVCNRICSTAGAQWRCWLLPPPPVAQFIHPLRTVHLSSFMAPHASFSHSDFPSSVFN